MHMFILENFIKKLNLNYAFYVNINVHFSFEKLCN